MSVKRVMRNNFLLLSNLCLSIFFSGSLALAQPVSDTYDGYQEVTNPDGSTSIVDSGGQALTINQQAEGLSDKYIFGEVLSSINKGNASTLELGNDPLVGSAPELPKEMRYVGEDLANGRSAISRSALSGRASQRAVASESDITIDSNIGGAVGSEALNLNISLGIIPNSKGITERSIAINSSQSLSKYALLSADPAALSAVDSEYQTTLALTQLANQTLANLRAALSTQGPAGELALRGLEACLSQGNAGVNTNGSNQAVVLLQCLGMNAQGNSVTMNSSGSSGSGGTFNLGGLLSGLTGGAMGAISQWSNTIGQYTSLAGQASQALQNPSGTFQSVFEPYKNTVTGAIQGVQNAGGQVTNAAGQVFNQNNTGQNRRSATLRSAVADKANTRNLFSNNNQPATIAEAVCSSWGKTVESDASAGCQSEAQSKANGGVVFAAIKNSYLVFPDGGTNPDAAKQARKDYQSYFGDQCLACIVGGQDDTGAETDLRLAVKTMEPEKDLKLEFNKINMEVYEALRMALAHKCYFDNAEGNFGSSGGTPGQTKAGADIFRIKGSAGAIETEHIYDDGSFWSSKSANKTGLAVNKMPGNKSVRETLQYLSFNGFTLTPAVMDAFYEIMTEKNSIGKFTTASGSGSGFENVDCDDRLGANKDWYTIFPLLSDGSKEEALKVKREVKALYNFSQRITLGKVYDACNQTLNIIQAQSLPELNHKNAISGVLKVCSKDANNPAVLAQAQAQNVSEISNMVSRLFAEQASDSGKSGSAVAKAFKGERSEAKSQVGG